MLTADVSLKNPSANSITIIVYYDTLNVKHMKINDKKGLIKYLKEFVTPERFETINRVLSKRTRYLTVVLEDLYQPHNASAVLRSCDGFGIQDVHIIENRNEF